MTTQRSDGTDVPVDFETYATAAEGGAEGARFTDWLRARAEPQWSAAIEGRFTEELIQGTIADDVYSRYLLQDYVFVETLVGTFGHAVGEAPTMAAKSQLVTFMESLTAEENDYFERSFDALGVAKEAYTNPETTATTRAFQDVLERAAREGGYAETLAVLVPAEWIYREWATAADAVPEPFYLGEWIDLHANEGFNAFVDWLREELDREGAAASGRRRARLDRLFRRTVELEVAFFESAYDADIGSNLGEKEW